MNNIANEIAERIKSAGGTAYFVGGQVRDEILGIDSKDIDIEIHGIEEVELCRILGGIGEPLKFGASFGVYTIKGSSIDIALPRKEVCIGDNHRDFEITLDPHIGTYEACKRRDFTMNSMLKDILTNEIVDHFHGLSDINSCVIRHVDSNHFAEDPLRVLRAAQFAARFEFTIAEETMTLCSSIDLSTLSRERVEAEMKKALLDADKPSIFFESLREMNQLEPWFHELNELIGVEQDPIHHPEGDVWVHTMEVIDRAAKYRKDADNPYAFMLLALCHDFGKILATEVINGRIHSYRHEILGIPLVRNFLNRIVGEKEVKQYVLNMVPLHMKPNIIAKDHSSVKASNRMFDEASSPSDLIRMSCSDKGSDPSFLHERLDIYHDIMSKPYVMGRDLIQAGIKPGNDFKRALEYAHKLRLAGIHKEKALKQTLSYIRKERKSNER